jgi:hypothetical protein
MNFGMNPFYETYFVAALRSSYSDISCQFLILLFSNLFFHYDYAHANETFLLNYFVISIFYRKIADLLLKVCCLAVEFFITTH